jgi:hypothetical protein
MRGTVKLIVATAVLCDAAAGICVAQVPTGTIVGTVHDSAGGVMRGAQVRTASRATGQVRSTTTGESGEYSLPALVPDAYEVSVEAAGFQRIARAAMVEAGGATKVDFVMQVDNVTAEVSVEAASPRLHYDSASVSGLVTGDQIQGLPLNGRGFLELGKLEPGVLPPTASNRNRTVVSVLAGPASNIGGPRFTVDGGSVTSIALGGSQIGFSQDAVREFQVSTVNFSLAAGMTDTGAINVVTRTGNNDLHATAFYFFRDHHLTAYPTLDRDPANPRPFFRRQQFGLVIGGPVRRNRVFYFVNWEGNDQRSVAATTLLAADFAHLSRITSNPLAATLLSARVDATINNAHRVFIRHSRDDNRSFGPLAVSRGSPNPYPSNWNRVETHAHQTVAGLTSVLGQRMVNDLRVSLFGLRATSGRPSESDCPGCLGIGAPSITIPDAGLVLGNSMSSDLLDGRVHLNESLTWQRRAHRARFGVDWEHNRDRNLIWNNDPVSMTLFSPDRVRAFNLLPGVPPEQKIPLPETFRTLDDILQLPVQNITVGIGNPAVPQEGGGIVRRWNTVWLFAEDVWQVGERVTLTYGLGWGVDGVLNHDLRKPALLAPILGAGGLEPTHNNWTNFSPTVGATWAPWASRKTVAHAGAGRFYRPHGLTGAMDAERAALGSPGLRQNFLGSSIANPLTGIPGAPLGAPLDFRSTPTRFTGATLLTILPALRTSLAQSLANADGTIQQIQITKQAGPAIFPVHVPNQSGVHLNLGFQHEFADSLVVAGDLVYRHFEHVPQNGGSIDANHVNSVRGPVIPKCLPGEVEDPHAQCSRGPINVQAVPYWTTYSGLLVRAEQRLSRGFHVLASYALSRNHGVNAGNGFNLENWLENIGPSSNDVRHILNVAGIQRLPWQLDLGFNFSYSSAQPFSAFVGPIDFNGDGTIGDLLPGTTVNAFNRGMGRADLERLVAQFNERYAGTKDPKGTTIPTLTLPLAYAFGDDFHALDLRLTWSFKVRRDVLISLIGEAFNLHNASNLSGYSGDLASPGFGQPTSQATQLFGSGGPRSFQVAMRLRFDRGY